ncbi:trigger factor [Candidatus Poribacteria bacterium]|nr:trigger factor [Candidatus Poribacteria bacterium]
MAEGVPLKVEIQDISSCKKKIKIEIPKEDVKAEIDKVYDEVRKEALVPGFRKGRAPRHILKMRFGEYIKTDVIESLIPKAFEEAITNSDLGIVRPMEMSDIEPSYDEINVNENEPIHIAINVDVKPDIELPDLSTLEVDKSEVNVTQEEVDKVLEKMRIERSDYIPVEDRPVQYDDFITIDLSANLIDDVNLQELETEEEVVQVNEASLIPGMAENFVGMNQGEEKSFTISLPEDYKSEDEEGWLHKNLAGKTVDFQVKVKKITIRQMPELNDEFAKDLGEEDIEHLRARVWNQMVLTKQESKRNEQEEELVEQLLDKCQFEVPEFLVEKNAETMMKIDESRYGESESKEEDVSKYRELATKIIKRNWIYEEIGEQEDFTVTEAELDSVIRNAAQQRGIDEIKYRSMLEDTNRLESMKSSIFEDKVVDFLLENASAKSKLII